jgi:hypothetical protein
MGLMSGLKHLVNFGGNRISEMFREQVATKQWLRNDFYHVIAVDIRYLVWLKGVGPYWFRAVYINIYN